MHIQKYTYLHSTTTHTCTQKAKSLQQTSKTAIAAQLGVYAPLRHSSLLKANPPGAGLVTRRRIVQVSWRKVMEAKFHNDLNTTKQDKQSWAFASPVSTRYSLMLQLVGYSPDDTNHQVPNIQLGRLVKHE